jgi:hypothetical protein
MYIAVFERWIYCSHLFFSLSCRFSVLLVVICSVGFFLILFFYNVFDIHYRQSSGPVFFCILLVFLLLLSHSTRDAHSRTYTRSRRKKKERRKRVRGTARSKPLLFHIGRNHTAQPARPKKTQPKQTDSGFGPLYACLKRGLGHGTQKDGGPLLKTTTCPSSSRHTFWKTRTSK